MAVVIILAGCTRPAPEPPPCPPAPPSAEWVRSSIESVAQHYKVYTLNGDARGIASLFTRTGRLELSGLPSLVGPRAISEGLAGVFKSARSTAWDLTFTDVRSLDPEIATAAGSVHERLEAGGKERQRWSRWTAAYRREADGYYRIIYLLGFPDSTR